MKVVVYLDDGIGMAHKDKARAASGVVRETLQRAGFVAHLQKSQWKPTDCLQWLGFTLDTAAGQIRVPGEKIVKILDILSEARQLKCIKAKGVASLTGKINSMWLGLGNIVRLMTRALYRLLQGRDSWHDCLQLDSDCINEIEFWLRNIGLYNGQLLWHSPSAVSVVFSDASETGYGGYVVTHSCYAANGIWEEHERSKSSTWCELVAVKRVLKDIADKIRGQRYYVMPKYVKPLGHWLFHCGRVLHIGLFYGVRKRGLEVLCHAGVIYLCQTTCFCRLVQGQYYLMG